MIEPALSDLALSEALKEAGMSQSQANASAKAISRYVNDNSAPRSAVERIEAKLDAMDAKFDALRVEIHAVDEKSEARFDAVERAIANQRWFIGVVIGFTGIVVTAGSALLRMITG